jgi:hypothetical protein
MTARYGAAWEGPPVGKGVLTLREQELVFDFVGALEAKVFDDESHGLSHCMKAVDFVVAYPDFDLLVEVKDPDNTKATPEQRAEFLKKVESEQLIRDLVMKCRDSWLYRWAEGREKPAYYVVLLQLSALRPPLLVGFSDRLKRALPVGGRAPTWTRPFLAGAAVLDIQQWNAIGDYGTVRRIPGSSTTPP